MLDASLRNERPRGAALQRRRTTTIHGALHDDDFTALQNADADSQLLYL